MGRSLSDGFSQVIATIAQICSAVYVAGFPERGASASRSAIDRPLAPCRHRLRQYRAVFGQMPTSRALSRTPTPSAAWRIRRARLPSCCGVEWARTNCSRTSRSSGEMITGTAAKTGMATSNLSFGFVMPQHGRFDSCFIPEAHPRSPHLRTAATGGVRTSAWVY